jgi:class 3 adenylate cyclase/DNA-binding NarL/FixJ family response regulator
MLAQAVERARISRNNQIWIGNVMTQPVIICVDDEPTVLLALKRELKSALGDECMVETAEGGEDALELFDELLEDRYEILLVISDYIMPDLKGDKVLKRIHEKSPNTVKIMLTGQADLEGITNAINTANLYRYIAKPWQSHDLALTIKEAISSYYKDKQIAQQNEELKQLNQSFSQFVPHQFLQCLDKSSIIDVQLGDHVEQEMSVVFSDIRDFTTLSENMTPKENFKFINSYLSQMEPAIIQNNGFIDKYIGDAIMALFGQQPDDAVNAGVAMLQQLTEYNKTRVTKERPPLRIGVGINTGPLMLGTVGGHFQMAGTVISDAVNLAARLESLTKQFGVSMLISHETFTRLDDPLAYDFRFIAKLSVKGKSKQVSVFEIFNADPPELRAAKLATKTVFEQALVLYYTNDYLRADKLFAMCLQQHPADTVAKLYRQQCRSQVQSLSKSIDNHNGNGTR